MKKILIILLTLFPLLSMGQDMSVKKFEMVANDLTARQNERLDGNNTPCALVKVELAIDNAKFEGDVVGDVAYKAGVYNVYLAEGSKSLKISHPSCQPLTVWFSKANSSINALLPKTTYVLTVNIQNNDADVPTGGINVIYTPDEAEVYIDGDKKGTTPLIVNNLKVGAHTLLLKKEGFVDVNKTINIEENQLTRVEGKMEDVSIYNKYSDKLLALAKEGDVKAIFAIAEHYYNGNGVKINHKKGIQYYTKAAELGYAEAQKKLGEVCYDNKDMENARKWYKLAAEQGDADALFKLGKSYDWRNNNEKERNLQEAFKWYKLASDKGNWEAREKIGDLYFYGPYGFSDKSDKFKKDKDEASKWYKLIGESNDPQAQYILAHLYLDGHKLQRDYEEAVKLLNKSARQGHRLAEATLYNYGLKFKNQNYSSPSDEIWVEGIVYKYDKDKNEYVPFTGCSVMVEEKQTKEKSGKFRINIKEHSDILGHFYIKCPANATLKIQSPGYKDRYVNVDGNPTCLIIMKKAE